MMRIFDGSGPTINLMVYNNGTMVYSQETELDPNYSFGTSEAPWFDHMTGGCHFTILQRGYAFADEPNESDCYRTAIWSPKKQLNQGIQDQTDETRGFQ